MGIVTHDHDMISLDKLFASKHVETPCTSNCTTEHQSMETHSSIMIKQLKCFHDLLHGAALPKFFFHHFQKCRVANYPPAISINLVQHLFYFLFIQSNHWKCQSLDMCIHQDWKQMIIQARRQQLKKIHLVLNNSSIIVRVHQETPEWKCNPKTLYNVIWYPWAIHCPSRSVQTHSTKMWSLPLPKVCNLGNRTLKKPIKSDMKQQRLPIQNDLKETNLFLWFKSKSPAT